MSVSSIAQAVFPASAILERTKEILIFSTLNDPLDGIYLGISWAGSVMYEIVKTNIEPHADTCLHIDLSKIPAENRCQYHLIGMKNGEMVVSQQGALKDLLDSPSIFI